MKSIQKTLVVFGVLAAVLVSALSIPFLNTFAYNGYQPALSELELYNQTNTFHVNPIHFDETGNFDAVQNNKYIDSINQYPITYNTTNRNNEKVLDKTQITVLTHGLGSSAADWSNTVGFDSKNDMYCSFAYDKDSIISKIDEASGGRRFQQ